jgi:hypothetical protein
MDASRSLSVAARVNQVRRDSLRQWYLGTPNGIVRSQVLVQYSPGISIVSNRAACADHTDTDMRGVELIHGDRRANRRYGFELPLRFWCQIGEAECTGSGRTVDLSRKGIRFVSDNPPPNATNVELRIQWPFLLQEVCPLELRVWGRVLRSDDQGTVVRMGRYEFHTCGARSFDQASAVAVNWSIVA